MKAMLLSLLVIAVLLVCSSVGMAIPNDKALILYFSFDDVKGNAVKDGSSAGNDGQIVDGATSVKGIYGNGLQLDGAKGSVTVNTSKSLETYQDHTLEFWLNYTEGSNGSWRQLIAKKAPGTERVPGIWTNPGGVGIHWRIDPGNTGAGRIGPKGENSDFELKKWYHIAGAKEKDKLRIYIDGQKAGEYNVPATHTQGAEKLYIGKTTYGPAGYIIDDLTLYNRALTENEVKLDMKGVLVSVSPKGNLSTNWGFIKKSF